MFTRLIVMLAGAISLLWGAAAFAEVVIPRDTVENFVNVRGTASGDSSKLGELRPGESLEYVDSVSRWHRVKLPDGTEGFVSKSWTLVISRPAAPVDVSSFVAHFLDVGTGDAAIIDAGDREIVIDGGDSIRVLSEYATRTAVIDGAIELAVVTHGDTDHWNGLRRLLGFDGVRDAPLRVEEFWDAGYDRLCNAQDNGGRLNYLAFISNIQELDGLVQFRRPVENHFVPATQSGTPTG